MKAIFFLPRKQTHIWWTCVKTDREEANKGPMEKWYKFKKLYLEYFTTWYIYSMRTRLKDFRQGI